MGRAGRVILIGTIVVGCGRWGFEPPRTGDGDGGSGGDGAGPDVALGGGLVAYYPMGQGQGSPPVNLEVATPEVMVDMSGHGLDGPCTIASCAHRDNGMVGLASRLNGAGAYRVPDAPLLHLEAGFTVALWIFNGQLSTPISKPQVTGVGASFELALQANETWFCTDHDPGAIGEDCLVTGVVLPPAWTHVAMVWDGSTKTLYVDGAVAGSETAPAVVFDGSPLLIGADSQDGTLKGFFDGKLDEIRIYDRALSAAEVVEVRDLR